MKFTVIKIKYYFNILFKCESNFRLQTINFVWCVPLYSFTSTLFKGLNEQLKQLHVFVHCFALFTLQCLSLHLSFSLCDNPYHKVCFVYPHFLSICCQTYWLFIHSVFEVSVCYEFILLCWNKLLGIMFLVMGLLWLFYIVVPTCHFSTAHSTHKIAVSSQ